MERNRDLGLHLTNLMAQTESERAWVFLRVVDDDSEFPFAILNLSLSHAKLIESL